MTNQFSQTDINEISCRTISGQLAEWGIDFSQSRVAQLAPVQIQQLQTWINAGVEADEVYQAEFASLPDFMESELLEMKGELASLSREEIIEQALNACEAEVPLTDNPYLFDTTGWHVWRKAYCCWYHGESLDFLEELSTPESDSTHEETVLTVPQQLKSLIIRFNQAGDSLKQLRLKLKQTRQERNTSRKQLMQFLNQQYELTEEEFKEETVSITEPEAPSLNGLQWQQSEPAKQSSELSKPVSIIRIPVTGPETNRVEVYLQPTSEGNWRAGHFWSVESSCQAGRILRGRCQLDQRQATFLTDSAALINETLVLSRKLTCDSEIHAQIVDYLNLLEEYPGQLDLCCDCHQHWLSEDLNLSGSCPQCSND
ncbi:hypothetical protein [Gimesia sp.]|uniref:hypothetical protein n=1 Tax=Gimesia sp. TaxID=2024833 RepID=UPI000C49A39C|nr:hypothetical protein [Gimesia sp.]MAX35714.1 hypothetical protein [Gimesia sp.]HAH45360.1 hypothetical protein [Planctomycetaceae bacterium]HBL47668.1 hypothetical protein [Planctomycetaceae bacterium]|tara:strand:- start:202 stop:1314 length:1113 start_codon:yes stop_codon:yes gene_type:complete